MVRVSPVPYSVRRPRKLSSVDLLPRVVIRPVALGMAGVACCLGVTGCAQFDKALGQSTVEVYFTDNTTPAAMIKIMNACNNVNPNVKEETESGAHSTGGHSGHLQHYRGQRRPDRPA